MVWLLFLLAALVRAFSRSIDIIRSAPGLMEEADMSS